MTGRKFSAELKIFSALSQTQREGLNTGNYLQFSDDQIMANQEQEKLFEITVKIQMTSEFRGALNDQDPSCKTAKIFRQRIVESFLYEPGHEVSEYFNFLLEQAS